MLEISEEILILVKKKMREQGAHDRESFRAYVEETIDYFVERGKLSEEENLEFLIDALMESWEGIAKRMPTDEE